MRREDHFRHVHCQPTTMARDCHEDEDDATPSSSGGARGRIILLAMANVSSERLFAYWTKGEGTM